MIIEEINIGNLVYNTKGEIDVVCVETFVKFNPQIQPIEVNRDWLERRFKFTENPGGGWTKFGVHFWFDEEKGITLQSIQQKVYHKYVHQLQNAIYMTTGILLRIEE